MEKFPRSGDQIETALPEDDQPVATEVKPPEGFWLGLGELTTVLEGEQVQDRREAAVGVDELTAILGDGAVVFSVGREDARCGSCDRLNQLTVQDRHSGRKDAETGVARGARPPQ
jgi:hypothetical protein